MKRTFVLLLTLGAACAALGAPPTDRLEAGFQDPPDSARPWVYWFIMDGNLSREGITADFESMKRAGIGGLIMMEVDAGIPKGPVGFMSSEWQQLFAHAVKEAERLGLQMTLNAGPGWTGSGGPWVKPEQSMRHLVASSIEVEGPRQFDGPLPLPQRRPAFFGDGGLPPDLERARNEYYEDVVVLAFPTPAGDNRIPDIDEKALYVRAPYSSQPCVRPFFPTSAGFPPDPDGSVVDPGQIVDLTKHLLPDGRLNWTVPEGRWTLLRFGARSTGANTRPAPAPGIGLESDKFDRQALESHFEAFVRPLMELVGRDRRRDAGWTSLHIDSWEMGAQNWTDAFAGEFRKRRGYDPSRYFPVLTGRVVGNREISERFLWDLRQTAQELVVENHAGHLKELGRREGLGLSIEPYDMNPCADLSLGGVADVPMCEVWIHPFNTFFSVIEATSIAHTLGKPIVAAESFTADDSERWQAHPASLKALGDWALCAGINRIVFHRFQHQPRLDQWPGMTMGSIGVHWERTQTWWDFVPAYHRYLAGCQFLLRQGLHVADVCFLALEGAPLVFRPPPDATRGHPPDRIGYSFDACAPETLLERASVRDGRITMPDGMTYRVLVLPESSTMTPGLLRKVRDLVHAGATVVGPRPVKSPSLSEYPSCDEEIRELGSELWGRGSARKIEPEEAGGQALYENRLGLGRVVFREEPASSGSRPPDEGTAEEAKSAPVPEQYGTFKTVERVLQGMGVVLDFTSEPFLRYIHRQDNGRDIYFVANPDARAVTATCAFRVQGKQPHLWDPVTGEVRVLSDFAETGQLTRVPIQFAPHQSFFVVFDGRPNPRSGASNFTPTQPLLELTGSWEVNFDPRWGGPDLVTFEKLEDWSKRAEPGIKFYSGKATYRTTFELSDSVLGQTDSQVLLDLGDVRNVARFNLNGTDLGVVWCPPWQADITGAAKPGLNSLEITIANLWPNRLIRDSGLLQSERLTATTWNPFQPGDQLLPSGLLGPVRLLHRTRPTKSRAGPPGRP